MDTTRSAKRRATLSDGESTSILPNRKRPNVASGPATPIKRLSHREYEIGWISAIPTEFAAAQALLDEKHQTLASDPNDSNHYVLGRVGSVNVVLTCLPAGGMGMNNAAITASNMRRTYVSLRLLLLVGIAGGVPTPAIDVRLGDIVVGLRLIQHDFGKTIHDGQFTGTATVQTPSTEVTTKLSALSAQYDMQGSQIPCILENMLLKHPRMTQYAIRDQLQDILFESVYEHPTANRNCQACDSTKLVTREFRPDHLPRIHFGTIASGNQVIKHAWTRDSIGARHDALCIEMEGAALKGLDKSFLVIRGICDYADTHKNKEWQPYAAAVAAAYAKEFLYLFPSSYNDTSDDIMPESESPQSMTATTNDLDMEKIGLILESLKFDELNTRLLTIRMAHGRTCQWLLEKQEYQDWLDLSKLSDHHGLLWIKGKPGTGKSTIMKFILGEFLRKNEDWIVISFFFNARGEKMEKTVQGLYQSLLLQILTQFPHTQCILHHSQSKNVEWTVASLQGLLHQALESLGRRQLVCMIDALDECHPDEVRHMVHFFEDLQIRALSQEHCFRVLFASRHYPHITVRKGVELILDDQEGHEQDIVNYVGDKLNIGTGLDAESITEEVQLKSAGIFMWVILVVNMLNEQCDEGANTAALRKELQRIPQDLHDLLRDILLRDEKNRENMLLCIQWLLFAQRPLSPVELYFAIHNSKCDTDAILLEWDPEKYSIEQINKFILASSKGLAEVTRSKTPTVQFIHESVNDFLLKEHGIQQVWPSIEENFKGKSHERLKSCCLSCIFTSKSLTATLSSRPQEEKQSLNEFRVAFTLTYPFLAYATVNVLLHAEAASGLGVTQGDFVSDFSGILEHWVELHNAFERHRIRHYTPEVSFLYLLAERDLNCVMRDKPELMTPFACLAPGEERYGPPLLAALARQSDASITTLVACLQGQDAMRYDHSTQGKPLREEDSIIAKGGRQFHYKDSIGILAYLADYGNVHILDAVFPRVKLQLHDRSKMRRGALSWAANPAVVQFLLKNGALLEHPDKSGRTPLSWAAEKDRVQTVAALLEYGAALEATVDKGLSPLHWAVRCNNLSVVKMLLERGANIDATDNNGFSPLRWAMEHENSLVVETLLERGAKIDATDNSGFSPLRWAAQRGTISTVRMILENGADTEIPGPSGDTALLLAATRGDAQVVQILLDFGAAMRAANKYWYTAMHMAARHAHHEVLLTLLQHETATTTSAKADLFAMGNDPDSKAIQAKIDYSVSSTANSNVRRTAVSLSAEHSSADDSSALDILLAARALVCARDEDGRTPLSWAATSNHERTRENITLLIKYGAEVDEQDVTGRTPLSWAATSNHARTGENITLLIKHGAELDMQDVAGRTPLSWVAQIFDVPETVHILLQNCAQVDLQDHNGRTPLSWAAQNLSGSKTAQVLLQNCAQVDSQDRYGQTPLIYAVQNRNRSTARLLLEHGAAIHRKDDTGKSSIDWARLVQDHDLVGILKSRRSVSS